MKVRLNICKLVGVLLAAAFLSVGCQSDYRTINVIKTDNSNVRTWQEGSSTLTILSGRDADAKDTFINPYAFNPNDFRVQGTWITNVAFNKLKTNYPNNASFYFLASSPTSVTGLSVEDRRYYRNDLQNAIFAVVKEATAEHLSALKAGDSRANLILGDAALALAGGASVAGGALAQAFAASAAGTLGAKSLFNEEVYRNTFVESIIALIQKDQTDFQEKIRVNWQSKSIYDYTVEAAIADAKEYETHGSLYHGLALLQEAVQFKLNGGTNNVAIQQITGALIINPTNIMQSAYIAIPNTAPQPATTDTNSASKK